MRARTALAIVLTTTGCQTEPITADTLDAAWRESIGWPEVDPDASVSTIIDNPGAITGELSTLAGGGSCLVTWSMTGESIDCRDCEYGFSVDLEVVEDTCGLGAAVGITFSMNRGYVYANYNRLASYIRTGNNIIFDSRTDSMDDPDVPYDYDYYYGYTYDYYGSATLLAR
jgi:hypothetical protein